MGVFKISKEKKSKAKSEMIREDLFHTEAQLSMDQTIKSYKPRFWSAAFAVVAASFFLGVSGYWLLHKSAADIPKPYVFFELKAIDQDGHPVAGAKVDFNGGKLGVTDSFGEWRRFMRVGLGSRVTFDISKVVGSSRITSSRVFIVPNQSPNEGEIELAGSVQLLTREKNEKKKVAKAVKIAAKKAELRKKKLAAEVNSDPEMVFDDDIDSISITDLPDIMDDDVEVAETSSKSGQMSIRVSTYDSVWFSYGYGSNRSATVNDIKSSKRLEAKILPLLAKRSQSLGLKVTRSSKWKIEVQHISPSASKRNSGLILVSATIPGSDRKIKFLKNYKKTNLSTARSILYGLKIHVAREYRIFKNRGQWFAQDSSPKNLFWKLKNGTSLLGSRGASYRLSATKNRGLLKIDTQSQNPCRFSRGKKSDCFLYSAHIGIDPPASNWSRLKVRLFGVESGAQVFVSGYRATHEGGKVWSYWGASGTQANLTVVKDDRIIFRKKIKSKKSKMVSVPGKSISRK